jgi:hypothetical protein
MIPLIDASPARIGALAEQCGFKDYGQLQTPLTSYSNHGGKWACDNGGFSRQDPDAFFGFMERRREYQTNCLWVAIPDVVGSARRTLEVFSHYHEVVRLQGWPIALVAQDGAEDMDIPWKLIDAVFIGGSTEWKMGRHAEGVIRAALWLRKKVHVGRINTGQRWEHFAKLGCHTFDGSALARPYPGHDGQRSSIALAAENFNKSVVQDAATMTGSTEDADTARQRSLDSYLSAEDYKDADTK